VRERRERTRVGEVVRGKGAKCWGATRGKSQSSGKVVRDQRRRERSVYGFVIRVVSDLGGARKGVEEDGSRS